jgi:hypothetical protein
VYNLSPHRYTKDTELGLSGKSIKEMAKGTSLISETTTGTLTSSGASSFLTALSF